MMGRPALRRSERPTPFPARTDQRPKPAASSVRVTVSIERGAASATDRLAISKASRAPPSIWRSAADDPCRRQASASSSPVDPLMREQRMTDARDAEDDHAFRQGLPILRRGRGESRLGRGLSGPRHPMTARKAPPFCARKDQHCGHSPLTIQDHRPANDGNG